MILLLVCLLAGFAFFVRWLWREESGLLTSSPPQKPRGPDTPERVLFVCTHNSARSQMAEALLRQLGRTRFSVASAGTTPTSVHPLTVQVMMERGLDLSAHRSKSLAAVGTPWDYVISLCEAAYEQCPEFPPKTCCLHWSIEDPARMMSDPADQLAAFRRVRDKLTVQISRWLADRPERS
jgi:arsenate reductase